MPLFVAPHSIVRRIWGTADTVLFIFAGAAAEFALNKAVDWLYFTGRLPADPLARLFSTVEYARRIVFAEQADAERTIARMAAIHAAVEARRGQTIPDWAYRDVLFLLIAYSIRAFELLERPLWVTEREEIVDVFCRVGRGMGIAGLPATYAEWELAREQHLAADLATSTYTTDLYRQYRRHLGSVRYALMRHVQGQLVPPAVRRQLTLPSGAELQPVLALYRAGRRLPPVKLLRAALLPGAYRARIAALDGAPGREAKAQCPFHTLTRRVAAPAVRA